MTSALQAAANTRTRLHGYLLAVTGAALFSTKAIFIKLAYQDHNDATLLLAYRMLFALPIFIAVGAWMVHTKKRQGEPLPSSRSVALAMLTGVLGYYLASLFDFLGLQYISAQLERLVLFTYPLFIMMIGVLVLGEKLTWHGIAAAGVTYAGLAVVLGVDGPVLGGDTWKGVGFVLMAALCFASCQVMARRVIPYLGSALFTSVAMITASVFCILHHVIAGAGNFAATPRFLWLAAGCALFATVMPVFLINAGLARISSEAVAMISTISPVVTIALAVSILGEPFTGADAIGSLLVLAGVGLYTWGDSQGP